MVISHAQQYLLEIHCPLDYCKGKSGVDYTLGTTCDAMRRIFIAIQTLAIPLNLKKIVCHITKTT